MTNFLLIVSILWLIIGHTLMWTLGPKLGPSGGLDSIGNAFFYVMAWRFCVWVPPIVFAVIGVMLFIKRKCPMLFTAILVLAGVVLISYVVCNTVGKRIIYTPEYLAKQTQSYRDYCSQNLNDFEQTKFTEQDRVDHYLHWQSSHMLDKVKRWVKTPSRQSQYVEAFLDYRLSELPGVSRCECIPSVLDVMGDTDTKKLLAYTGAKDWCTSHYGYGGPRFYTDHLTVIVYYEDETIDAVDIY